MSFPKPRPITVVSSLPRLPLFVHMPNAGWCAVRPKGIVFQLWKVVNIRLSMYRALIMTARSKTKKTRQYGGGGVLRSCSGNICWTLTIWQFKKLASFNVGYSEDINTALLFSSWSILFPRRCSFETESQGILSFHGSFKDLGMKTYTWTHDHWSIMVSILHSDWQQLFKVLGKAFPGLSHHPLPGTFNWRYWGLVLFHGAMVLLTEDQW